MIDVARWLAEQGLGQYAEVFAANAVEGEILCSLTEADLKELGISALGHRKRLLHSIAALRTQLEATASQRYHELQKATPGIAERRQLTVLFCDLVGSTALSGRLDPEDLREVIGAYQDACVKVAARFDAYVAKFLGDGVLIYFGWPQAHEDDAERAVSAGLALIEAISRLRSADNTRLQARIGIATGPVVIGDLAGREAADTVIGETPNLAARLQTLAKPGAVLISPTTRRLVSGLFELEDLGPQRLKGFANAQTVWRVKREIRLPHRFEAKHPVGYTRLVGREEEISLFLHRWQQVKGGEGQIVVLSGPPGIGKSRLVSELRERLRGEAYVAPLLQGSPFHTSTPLHPVIHYLAHAAGLERDDTPMVKFDKLQKLLAPNTQQPDVVIPLMAALLGISAESRSTLADLTPQHQKQLTLEAAVEQLEGLAAAQPVLFICEDVQWFDPTTLELLGLVVQRIEPLRMMLLITARPDFPLPWAGHGRITALSLNGLGREQGAAVAEQIADGKVLPGELLEEILERTDGIPLFIEELTKQVIESGILVDAGSSYTLTGPLLPLAIPATLHDSLLSRLDRLGRAKEIAQVGAAIGRDFSYAMLTAVAGRPEKELREMLEQLVSSGLVKSGGLPPAAVYSFKHALVRDAAYESLLKSRRRQIHATIARALEERWPEAKDAQPELLAHHYAGAGQAQQAADSWRRAAERALQRFANSEAIAHCDKAVMQIRALPPSREQMRAELEVQLAKGVAVRAARGYSVPDSEQVFLRACELSEQLGDRVSLVHALRGLFGAYYVAARWSDAARVAHRICAATDGLDDRVMLCIRWMIDGATRLFRGEPTGAVECLREALRCYHDDDRDQHIRLTGHEMSSLIRFHLAIAEWLTGQPEGALRTADEAVAIARNAMQPFSLVQALGNGALLRILARDWDRAEALAKETLEISMQHRIPDYVLFGNLLVGVSAAMKGDIAHGVALARESMAGLNRAGWQCFIPILLVHLAVAQETGGEGEAAHEAAGEALSMIRATGEAVWEAEALRVEALGKLASGGGEAEAEAILQAAVDIARQQGAKAFELRSAVSLSRLWAKQGKRREGHALLGPIYAGFTEGWGTTELPEARNLLDELR
ncbi:ATP-binding protein [Microvirga pakistanensis]|uniref:ATP-binding protein n=1 Tax=Microvirga pakistanensis TaxID=1682650 RepID=UPI00141B9FE0|nr:adenylate/guanylate cyclase domain-containing protein [Microvirga pakistanensis]